MAYIEGKIYQKEIEQHLIYYGEGKPKRFTGKLKHTNFTYRYKIHSLSKVSFRDFLMSNTPQEVVFAVLANPEGQSSESVLQLIVGRLIQLSGNTIATRKFIQQLIMLSKKHNLR